MHGVTLGTVFERFTERARPVVVLAQEESRLGHAGPEKVRTEILRHLSGMSGVASAGPEPDDVELTCPPLAPQVLAELEGLRRDEHAARDRRELAVADALRDAEGRPRLAATWLVREWQRSPRDAD
jgi:hypothetical protein